MPWWLDKFVPQVTYHPSASISLIIIKVFPSDSQVTIYLPIGIKFPHHYQSISFRSTGYHLLTCRHQIPLSLSKYFLQVHRLPFIYLSASSSLLIVKAFSFRSTGYYLFTCQHQVPSSLPKHFPSHDTTRLPEFSSPGSQTSTLAGQCAWAFHRTRPLKINYEKCFKGEQQVIFWSWLRELERRFKWNTTNTVHKRVSATPRIVHEMAFVH